VPCGARGRKRFTADGPDPEVLEDRTEVGERRSGNGLVGAEGVRRDSTSASSGARTYLVVRVFYWWAERPVNGVLQDLQ
jgi:hypothetical protein